MPETNYENPQIESENKAWGPDPERGGNRQTENRPEIQSAPERRAEKSLSTASATAAPNATTNDAPQTSQKQRLAEIEKMDTEHKIETLSMVAFADGIEKSVAMARALKDPYILDALHDKLIGELYNELIKKGKLKEI